MAIDRRWTLRCYDLDQRGVLGPPGLLRLFEQMRWESIADDVVPWRRLLEGGNRFVVRAQRLDLIGSPLGHGAAVALQTWLGRAGRSSCDVCGTAVGPDGGLVATSTVTVVYCGPDGRPRALPAEAQSWTEPGGFATAPAWPEPAPAGAFRASLVVRPSDMDFLHHVNHARWVDFVEDARLACAAAGGYGAGSANATGPARHLSIDYAREAAAGDLLEVRTWSRGRELAFELARGEQVVARALEIVEGAA